MELSYCRTGYEVNGLLEVALSMLGEEGGFKPNNATFTSLISASAILSIGKWVHSYIGSRIKYIVRRWLIGTQ